MFEVPPILAWLYFIAGGAAAITGIIAVFRSEIKVGGRGGIKTLTGRQGKRVGLAIFIGGLLAFLGGLLSLTGVSNSIAFALESTGTLIVILAYVLAGRITPSNL